MSEFTGERLVPGEVATDLWNEHISRYAFAASLCKGRERVLDAGCGTGYGSHFLSMAAGSVLGIDYSSDAIQHAVRQYGDGRTLFAVGLCEALPVADQSAELIAALEVIEHLPGWRKFLEECYRALVPDGFLLVSTPNKNQYAESRGAAGPNPFHVHEFEFDEFAEELGRSFPYVRIFGQNHSASIVFSAVDNSGVSARLDSLRAEPEQAAFFVALCGKRELPDTKSFVFVPETANVLSERERHIRLLTDELHLKDSELAMLYEQHAALVKIFRRQKSELESSNAWAESLNNESQARAARIGALQDELAEEQARALVKLEHSLVELEERTTWARDLDKKVKEYVAELAHCVELLHAAEALVEERTNWALALQTQIDAIQASRWVRLGRSLRVGPEL